MSPASHERHTSPARRLGVAEQIARRVPGVGAISSFFSRIAGFRIGRLPVGLALLLPVALALDLFDAADELFLGPVGMALAFVLETGFVLGVTGRASWALGGAGIDLIPGIDVVPVATLTLLARIAEVWSEESGSGAFRPDGPVIDV